jgi:hypothetical protein
MLDHCGYAVGCPFTCPLLICVKEYPGGADGYQKDALIKALMLEGKDMNQISKIIGMSVSAVERRYNNADFHNIDPTKAIPANRS